MFNAQTIDQLHAVQLWSSCTKFYNQTRSQSRNEINTRMEHLVQKHNDYFALIETKLFWSLTKKKNMETRKKS